MTNEVQKWEPREFDGTDLLPSNIPQEDMLPGPEDVPIVGNEAVVPEDIKPPTLAVLQGLSPAVVNELEGARPGRFILTSTEEVFESPLRTLLVHYSKSNRLRVDPSKPEFEGLEDCTSRDGIMGDRYGLCEECGKCLEWGEDGSKPLGAKMHVFVVLTSSGPAFVRFKRTSYKSGDRFITAWQTSPVRKNLWAHPVILRTRKETGTAPDGSPTAWYVLEMAWDRKERTPDDWQKKAYEVWQQLHTAAEEGRLATEHGADEDFPEDS